MTDFEDASVNENGQPLGNTPESPTPPDAAPTSDLPPEQAPAPVAPVPEPAVFGWGTPAVPEPPLEPAPAASMPPEEPSPAFDTPAVIPEPSFEFVPEAAVAEPAVPPAPVPEPPVEPAPAVPTPPVEPVVSAPEAQPETVEPTALEAAVPAVAATGFAEADAAGFSDGLTGELRALTDELEPPVEPAPTATEPAEAIVSDAPAADADSAVPAEAALLAGAAAVAAPAATAGESLDDIAPGTVATEGEHVVAAPGAEGEAVTAEGEAVVAAEGEEPAVEGAEAGAEGAAPEGAEAAAVAAAEGDEAALQGVVGPRTTVSWWPFVGYLVVWLGAAAYAVWQLQMLPVGQAAYETNLYTMSMLGGLVLLAVGPVLLLIVWLASWIGRENRRIGLMFISALLKGALATLIGAMIWIGALMLVDYLRLGRPF